MSPAAWRGRQAVAWFFALWVMMSVAGWWLLVDRHYVIGDAVSRVGNAWATVASRDPHLSAIGFVFSPLNTIALIPVVELRPLLPELVTDGYAAVLVSAAFMAGAVIEMFRVVREHTADGRIALLAAVVFLANPIILLYGVNGMSEAAFLFFVLRVTRGLARWARDGRPDGLVLAGIALALAYLVRYEATVVGAAATFVVVATRLARDRHLPGRRWSGAITDGLLIGLPLALAFVGWAIASWLVTGQPFVQFSGTYGNTAIAAAEGVHGAGPLKLAGQTFGLTPLLPVVVLAAGVVAVRRGPLMPAALVLPALASLTFSWWSIHGGTTFDFLRYLLIAVPVALMAATSLPRPALWITAVGLLAIPVAWATMMRPTLGVQEHALGAAILGHPTSDADTSQLAEFRTEHAVAHYLDGLHLPEGSVMVDTSSGFAVVMASDDPKQFVIPSDRDFDRILDHPYASGVRYALTFPDTRRGRDDALNRKFPGIYTNGDGIGEIAFAAQNDGPDPDMRLYRLVRDPR